MMRSSWMVVRCGHQGAIGEDVFEVNSVPSLGDIVAERSMATVPGLRENIRRFVREAVRDGCSPSQKFEFSEGDEFVHIRFE